MLRRSSLARTQFLETWAIQLRNVISLEFGVPVTLVWPPPKMQPVNGPRIAGLKLKGGNKIGEVISFLEKNGMANLRRSIPKEETHPECIRPGTHPMTGWIGADWWMVSVSWHDRLAENDVQTHTLLRGSAWADLAHAGNYWIAGLQSAYEPVRLSLDIFRGAPHYFFLGTTQSGKSTAEENAVAQLALCPKNRFIFIDVMKQLSDWAIMPALAQCIGPPALTVDDARAALTWLHGEMGRRYSTVRTGERIICVVDELPGLSTDKMCVYLIDKLTSAGAQRDIHLLLAAQHAIEKALGPFAGILKANVAGRMIFHTPQLAGSVAGMHDNRALALGVPGDCWVLNSNFPPTRIQASYFPDEFLVGEKKWKYGRPEMAKWPNVSGPSTEDVGNPNGFPDELVAQVVAFRLEGRLAKAKRGYGRRAIQNKFSVLQNESVRLIKITDPIVEAVLRLGEVK